MKIPTRPSYPNTKLASQEKLDERESWHKLVVKVITWKDGSLEKSIVKEAYRITAAEWKTYSQHITATNTSYSKERVLSSLEETKEIIADHGGFE